MDKLDDATSLRFFKTIYLSLSALARVAPEMATPSIAGLRLLLIDRVGEERQSELIGQWNDEIASQE